MNGSVVVRLEPPDRWRGSALDPDRLVHAVEELIRAIDPTLTARVQVEILPEPRLVQTAFRDTSTPPPGPSEPTEDLELDLASRSLVVDGHGVPLTRREFDLLAHLHDRRGIALSRRDLMTAVWQSGYLAGDRTIDVHVRRLRVKLGRHAARLQTLRGYGYRLD